MIFMLPKPYLGFVGNKTEALVGYKTEVGVSGGIFIPILGFQLE